MSIVYFSSKINKDEVVKLYKKLNPHLEGPIAVKLHSGEPGNQNFIKPEFWEPIISLTKGKSVIPPMMADAIQQKLIFKL